MVKKLRPVVIKAGRTRLKRKNSPVGGFIPRLSRLVNMNSLLERTNKWISVNELGNSISISLEMWSTHNAMAWSQAPPPSTPQMPLSSHQPLHRNQLAVWERLFAPGKTQHAVTLFPAVQNKHKDQICLVRLWERMTQLGVSVLTHVTLPYHGQVMTLNVPVVNYTNVPLLRGYYVAARFQSDICKLVPCHELVKIYCKLLRFWEKKWLIEAFSNYSNNQQDLFVYKEHCTRKYLELISHWEILTS